MAGSRFTHDLERTTRHEAPAEEEAAAPDRDLRQEATLTDAWRKYLQGLKKAPVAGGGVTPPAPVDPTDG